MPKKNRQPIAVFALSHNKLDFQLKIYQLNNFDILYSLNMLMAINGTHSALKCDNDDLKYAVHFCQNRV